MIGLRKLLLRYKLSRIRYIVWDFDGTLYQDNDEKIGKFIKNKYIQFLKRSAFITPQSFDELTKKHGSWGKAGAETLKISEIDFLNKIENNKNYRLPLLKNRAMVKRVEKLNSYKHIILTNSTSRLVSDGLRTLGFSAKNGMDFFPFEKIFTRDATGFLKPDKRAFSNVISYTHEPAYKHIFIGDSYVHDIKPASELGFVSFDVNHFWKEINPLISR